jgi:hypothetical protein
MAAAMEVPAAQATALMEAQPAVVPVVILATVVKVEMLIRVQIIQVQQVPVAVGAAVEPMGTTVAVAVAVWAFMAKVLVDQGVRPALELHQYRDIKVALDLEGHLVLLFRVCKVEPMVVVAPVVALVKQPAPVQCVLSGEVTEPSLQPILVIYKSRKKHGTIYSNQRLLIRK